MSIFGKLFGKTSNSERLRQEQMADERSKYMPDEHTPADERFTKNFILNGGKFLYSVNPEETQDNFDNILLENDWYENPVFCIDENLKKLFDGYNLNYGTKRDASFYLTTCESLIADNGSILICSNQLKEMKIHEFPQNMVVFASTSQIVNNIGEGLRLIKNRNAGNIPTNITTIKHFEIKEDEKDFLSYGSSTKNLYLLLLEDL
ncbi:lactate utilization protein B/C [Dokdonia sinensis]|uniref:Lactate utilization protein B/C n=1 Tax=Dokdonia sinensis TaxID=2479847 RepID=A0A3M0GH62_9FLAO|nr:LUD domain-containing protein [Dokdonia sinensis]RMB63897.1 lactate utilization protein B/C [Dokdonia sinensis]